jgi:hypothetical protein
VMHDDDDDDDLFLNMKMMMMMMMMGRCRQMGTDCQALAHWSTSLNPHHREV